MTKLPTGTPPAIAIAERPPRTCKGRCGNVVPPRATPGREREWCSERCRQRTLRSGSGAIPEHRCDVCGGLFTPRRVGARYCSAPCRIDAGSAQRKARLNTLPCKSRSCAECGKVWRPKPPNYDAKLCGLQCQRLVYRAAYRAREKAAFVEHVYLHILLERDEGICQLCGGPVDMHAHAPAYDSPSRDHIVPLSRGGEHSYANIHLAHMGCNQWKSDRTDLTVADFRAHREETLIGRAS